MIEDEEPFRDPSVRRRRRLLFRERKVPVRLLVPNFFTLLSLCAGVTAIRMAIEGRTTAYLEPGPEALGMPAEPENNRPSPRISDRVIRFGFT